MTDNFYRGASNITMDSKGRLAIPSRYRNALKDSCQGALFLTASYSGCILIYPHDEWLAAEQQICQFPTLNKSLSHIRRLMIGFATESEMDAQGRVLIPNPLRDYAQIKTQAMLLGQGEKFELWDPNRWDKECQSKAEEDLYAQGISDEFAEKVRF